MLKCSTWNCKEKPIKQCDNCYWMIFCEECAQDHYKKHDGKNIKCNFGDIQIKLSVAESIKLKQSIEESVKAIKNQKKAILSQAIFLHNEIDKIISSSIEHLDEMIKEYKELNKKTMLKKEDYLKAKAIICEFLVFDNPHFSKIEAVLTKNSKIRKINTRRSSIFAMEYNYGLKIEGHRFGINRVAISSNDQFVVTGSEDFTVRVWDFHKKQQQIIFDGHSDKVTSISISKDCKLIVSASYDSVRVWDLIKKRQVAFFHGEAITSVVISNDNQFIVHTSNCTFGPMKSKVVVRSLYDNKYKVKFKGHANFIICVAITSDNQFVVSGSGSYSKKDDNTIRVWSLIEKQQKAVLKGHTKAVYCLALTKDDMYIVSGSADKTIRIWDLLKQQQVEVLLGHINGVVTIAISSDNTFLVSGSVDKTIKVWNWLEKRQETEFLGHTDTVFGVAITSDNQFIVSVSSDLTIKVWNIINRELKLFEAHGDAVNCVSITSNYKFALSGSGSSNNSTDKRVIVWNLLDKKQEFVLEGHGKGVLAVAISRDNRFILTGSWDCTIIIWNFIDKTQEAVLRGHRGAVKSVAITSDNLFAVSGSYDMTVRVWNLANKQEKTVLKGHTAYVNSVAITSSNQCSSISKQEFIIWDLVNNIALVSLKLLYYSFFSLDESLFVLNLPNDFNTISVWNLNQKRHEGLFKECSFVNLTSIDITKSSRYLVFGFKEKVVIRKALNSKANLILKGRKKVVNYTGKGRTKVLAYDKRVTDEALLHGFRERQFEVLYTNDNRYIVSHTYYTVRVWDLNRQKLKAFLYLSDNITFRGVAVSKLGNKIYLIFGLGISTFNIDENVLEHELFFDKKLEELFNNEPSFEDYLPQIAYIDSELV